MSEQDFSSAVREFRQAVGDDWVFVSDEDRELYRDAYSPSWGEDEELLPAGAVAPTTVEQVQLRVLYQGARPEHLEERTDLVPDLRRFFSCRLFCVSPVVRLG